MPDTESTSPARRPVRRLGRSFLVTLQFIAFFIVMVSVNYLSCAKHHRIDLTERKSFTLSDSTHKLLKGESIQNRESPVRIIAVIRRNSQHYSRMRNLLDEYSRIGDQAVELEFVDPARQVDRTLEIAKIYRKPYIEDMIIVDGRSEDASITATEPAPSESAKPSTEGANPEPQTESDSESKSQPQSDPSLSGKQQLSAHVRSFLVKQLYIEDLDQFNNRFISAWQDEDVITSSLIGAIEGRPRKIYFAADKSSLEATDGKPAWQVLSNMLWQQNIQLVPIRLTDIETIPADAEGLALIGPQYDLDDREVSLLKEYWDRPKSAILVTLDPLVELNKLRIFLRNYGVSPRNDRIITVQDGEVSSSVRALFTRGAQINEDLGGNATIFDGSSSSLEVREKDEQLLNKRIIPIALIQASEGWWGETRDNVANPEFNEEEDYAAPLYLAAAILRGQATSDDTAAFVSKMVIIANTDFLTTKNTRPEQADFVKSSINWLVGREELIGIGPRKLHRHKMTILDSHNSFINKILILFFPAGLILTSLIVWNVRRS